MALIRNADAAKIARDAVVLDLGDIAAQGRRLVEEAERKAASIIRDAEAERERLVAAGRDIGEAAGRDAGHAEGVEIGRREGMERAYAEHASAIGGLLASWEEALHGFKSRRDRLYDESIADVVNLAIAIGEKVVRRTIDADPAVVVRQVSEALGMVSAGTRVTLRVHPADRALVEELFPALVADGVDRDVSIRADETLSRGSCVADYSKDSSSVATRHERHEGVDGEQLSPAARTALAEVRRAAARSERSTVDASIETQMDRIVEALLPGRIASDAGTLAEPHAASEPEPEPGLGAEADEAPPTPDAGPADGGAP